MLFQLLLMADDTRLGLGWKGLWWLAGGVALQFHKWRIGERREFARHRVGRGRFIGAPQRPGAQTRRAQAQGLHAARAAAATADKKRKTGEDDDIDFLLPAPELSDIKAAFYGRYMFRFPLKTEPCNKLVSRLAREMSRRAARRPCTRRRRPRRPRLAPRRPATPPRRAASPTGYRPTLSRDGPCGPSRRACRPRARCREVTHPSETRRSRKALLITETELRLIAAAAIIGLSKMPKEG